MFGIDIIDAGLLPSMLIALLAGIFSFLSPCVLPIVPPYLAYMGGISMQEMENNKMEHNIGTDDKARPFSIFLLRERERE